MTSGISPALVGALRGLGVVIVFAIVTWATNSMNLAPVFGNSAATIIAMVALAIEHVMSPNGTALAGSVNVR